MRIFGRGPGEPRPDRLERTHLGLENGLVLAHSLQVAEQFHAQVVLSSTCSCSDYVASSILAGVV